MTEKESEWPTPFCLPLLRHVETPISATPFPKQQKSKSQCLQSLKLCSILLSVNLLLGAASPAHSAVTSVAVPRGFRALQAMKHQQNLRKVPPQEPQRVRKELDTSRRLFSSETFLGRVRVKTCPNRGPRKSHQQKTRKGTQTLFLSRRRGPQKPVKSHEKVPEKLMSRNVTSNEKSSDFLASQGPETLSVFCVLGPEGPRTPVWHQRQADTVLGPIAI